MAGYRKLGLPTDQRKAMLRNLVTSLLKHGKIETTETRAKETRSIAEKMITLGKRGDLHARRQVLAYVQEELVVKNLFDNVAPKYAERNGGYTRMIKKGPGFLLRWRVTVIMSLGPEPWLSVCQNGFCDLHNHGSHARRSSAAPCKPVMLRDIAASKHLQHPEPLHYLLVASSSVSPIVIGESIHGWVPILHGLSHIVAAP